MAVQFALRPRIRLDHEAAPQRKLRAPRLHPLVLPIAAYWLALAGVAHAVIESTRHPLESTMLDARPEIGRQPAPLFEENSTPNVVTNLPTARDDEPSTAPAVPEPASQSGVSNAAPMRDSEPAAAFAAVREPAPERAPERHAPMKSAPAPDVLEAAPPLAESAPPRRETSEVRREQPMLQGPAPYEDAPPKSSLPSCEAVAESAQETMDLRGARGAPDLTRDTFANVLENGAYLGRCAIPDRTALEICAAVQDGKVVGVSVRAQPRDAAISNCVRHAVAALRFPRSARLDITRTRFDATR